MASMSREASFTDEGRGTWGINDCGLKIISRILVTYGVGGMMALETGYPGQAY